VARDAHNNRLEFVAMSSLKPLSFNPTVAGSEPQYDGAAAVWGWARSVGSAGARSRWLLGVMVAGLALVFGTWVGIRTVPWFGPALADGLRGALGSENVTRLEEVVADVEDRVQAATSGGAVRGLSESTPPDLLAIAPVEPARAPSSNRPRDVGALHAAVASKEDGVWQPVTLQSGDGPAIYRTIVHPDPERAYAELFVFALDLSKLRLHAVAGSIEPKTENPLPGVTRAGLVPEVDRKRLVAAFNGGFKVEHGRFGMMVGGTELVAPRPKSCTFGELADGSLTIASWSAIASEPFSWWRQTPGCMLENGMMHPGLRAADSKNWGATLEGKTVIRRSAVGLGADRKTLFVGISNSTTARALALGMQQAGASTVAQLDVNHSYPRFLLYRQEGSALTAKGAVKGLLYEPDEYIGRASTRDFFYVTAR
jgi:hypothetical protein